MAAVAMAVCMMFPCSWWDLGLVGAGASDAAPQGSCMGRDVPWHCLPWLCSLLCQAAHSPLQACRDSGVAILPCAGAQNWSNIRPCLVGMGDAKPSLAPFVPAKELTGNQLLAPEELKLKGLKETII